MSNYDKIRRGVQEHNAQAQLMFYDLYIQSVFRTAYAIVGNESEAEEIAQDAMLKVFNQTDLLNDDAKAMERILRRITSNASIDVVRRRKDFIFSVEEVPDYEDSEADENSPDFSIEEIKEAITALSVNYRGILSLRLFEDLSFAEIAEMLATNYSTVRVQYIRGITKLKDLLIKNKSYD